MAQKTVEFDPKFASVEDFARLYRQLGLQVVPSLEPRPGEQWKRPAVAWKPLEQALVDNAAFEGWFHKGRWGYPLKGDGFRFTTNAGLITGECSGRIIVLDLDHPKGLGSQQWWQGLLVVHNNGMELETVRQTTGGGGKQLLLRWPPGRPLPSAHKTPIGVDIRGQGAFAVLPPSRHESGGVYAWDDGLAPWEAEIIDCPIWLCEAIEKLIAQYGKALTEAAAEPGSNVALLPPPTRDTNFAGEQLDGREGYMTELVWAACVDLRRAFQAPPPPEVCEQAMLDAYGRYEANVSPRTGALGEPKGAALEREGRGLTLFRAKFTYALAQWGHKLARDAADAPPPRLQHHQLQQLQPQTLQRPLAATVDAQGVITRFDPVTGEVQAVIVPDPRAGEPDFRSFDAPAPEGPRTFKRMTGHDLLRAPAPRFLVEGCIIAGGLGFISGEPGCGKSFVANDLGLTIANGLGTWMGRSVHGRGGVLYLAGEGQSGAKLRYMAWQHAKGVSDHDAPFEMIFAPIDFMSKDDVQALIDTVGEYVNERGETPALIIVDTVSRVLPGAEENKQADMTLFVGACDRLRHLYGATVIGVHHVTKGTNRMRGSSVLTGAADFVLALSRPEKDEDEEGEEPELITGQPSPDEDGGDMLTPPAPRRPPLQVNLLAEKIKDAPDGWTQRIELHEVDCCDIAASRSLVAFPAWKEERRHQPEPQRPGERRDWHGIDCDADTCARALEVVREVSASLKPLSTGKAAFDERRDFVQVIAARLGLDPKTVEAMRKAWTTSGVITLIKPRESHPLKPKIWSSTTGGYVVTGDLGDGLKKYELAREREQHGDPTGTDG